MSLELKLVALTQAIGADIKSVRLASGDLTSLNTTTKTSLVAAINELRTMIGSAGAVIDDGAGDGDDDVTWSANKIHDTLTAAVAALKGELLGGAGAALDTLGELATALGNDANFATTLATSIANRVRYDEAQTLTSAQKIQARSNIDAASATAVGDTERDLVAVYSAAKA